MPIYEYGCEKCKKVHEVTQKLSDKPLKKCPDCGAAVTKLVSRSSFSLKGGGWYTTDYKRAKASAAPAACEPASDAGCAKPDCKKKA
jgi:putative FmdB family regulatory protein